jgi:hypothetical protein
MYFGDALLERLLELGDDLPKIGCPVIELCSCLPSLAMLPAA